MFARFAVQNIHFVVVPAIATEVVTLVSIRKKLTVVTMNAPDVIHQLTTLNRKQPGPKYASSNDG
jgi:hypothetical protein